MGVQVVLLLYFIGNIDCKVLTMTCSHIKHFVDGHNWRRKLLVKDYLKGQPAAAEMNFMVWDSELAKKAEGWASMMRREHNDDKTVPSGRFETGENYYWYYTTDLKYVLSPEPALDFWFDEHKDYTYGPLSADDLNKPKMIGHYTQMVWSNSTYLGCGMAQEVANDINNFLVVCNYGPPGNYIGDTPYKSGKPAGRLLCSIKDCSQPYGEKCPA